jgi:hypothetical protein
VRLVIGQRLRKLGYIQKVPIGCSYDTLGILLLKEKTAIITGVLTRIEIHDDHITDTSNYTGMTLKTYTAR